MVAFKGREQGIERQMGIAAEYRLLPVGVNGSTYGAHIRESGEVLMSVPVTPTAEKCGQGAKASQLDSIYRLWADATLERLTAKQSLDQLRLSMTIANSEYLLWKELMQCRNR